MHLSQAFASNPALAAELVAEASNLAGRRPVSEQPTQVTAARGLLRLCLLVLGNRSDRGCDVGVRPDPQRLRVCQMRHGLRDGCKLQDHSRPFHALGCIGGRTGLRVPSMELLNPKS